MLWHISDTHFNHSNIMAYEPGRPNGYENIIFRNIERLVLPEDTLLHHGDFTFGPKAERERVASRWKQIDCKEKILILGNHDRHPLSYYEKECGFTVVVPFFLVRDRVLFSHYPRAFFGEYRKDERYQRETEELARVYQEQNCIMQVHGHTHSWCHPDRDTYMNVSVENINYSPVSWDVVYAKALANLNLKETFCDD